MTDLTEVELMPENEMLYQMSIAVAKSMLKQGLITGKVYSRIDTILRDKFHPILADILSEKT